MTMGWVRAEGRQGGPSSRLGVLSPERGPQTEQTEGSGEEGEEGGEARQKASLGAGTTAMWFT